MGNAQTEYIKKLANEARKKCEEVNLIKPEEYKLSLETLKNVTLFFNGSLKQITSEELQQNSSIAANSFMKKTSYNEFTIEYVDFSILDILHNLGYVFLDFDKMKVGKIRFPRDFDRGLIELNAARWSRFFAMPENLFEKAIIEHSDIQIVANIFGVDELQVTIHGRELHLWK